MQPLNYSRQFRAYFDPDGQRLKNLMLADKALATNTLVAIDRLASAPKFLLPDGGRILSEIPKHWPEDMRLPFPVTVLEYTQPKLPNPSEALNGIAPKRIVIAEQLPESQGIGFTVCSAFQFSVGYWTLEQALIHVTPGTGGRYRLRWASLSDHYTATETFDEAAESAAQEVDVVLSLLEALACSNVTHEAIPTRKQNKKAQKNGALPFDEYRVLTLISTKKISTHGEAERSYRSPREHLRRGHIRRLESGKTVWVQAAVVNAGIGGVILRDYDLRKTAKSSLPA